MDKIDPSLIKVQVVTALHEQLDIQYKPKSYEEYFYWQDAFRFLPRIGDAIYHDHLMFKVERVLLYPVIDPTDRSNLEEFDTPTLVVSYLGEHIEIQKLIGLRDEDGYWDPI